MSGASAQRPSASKTRFSARLANKNTPTSQDNYDSDSESASSELGVDGNGSDICTGEDYTTEDMDESKEGNPMKGFLELESYICYCEEQSFRVSQNDLPVEHDSRCKVLDYFGMVFLEHLRVLYCPTRNRITPMSEWAAHIKGSHADWMSANKIKDCDSMAKHVADSHNLSMKSTFKDLDLPNEIDNPLSTKTKNLTFSYQCPICDLWTATDKDSNQPDRYTRRHLQTKCLKEAGDDYKTIGLSKPRWIFKVMISKNPTNFHSFILPKEWENRDEEDSEILPYPQPPSLDIDASHIYLECRQEWPLTLGWPAYDKEISANSHVVSLKSLILPPHPKRSNPDALFLEKGLRVIQRAIVTYFRKALSFIHDKHKSVVDAITLDSKKAKFRIISDGKITEYGRTLSMVICMMLRFIHAALTGSTEKYGHFKLRGVRAQFQEAASLYCLIARGNICDNNENLNSLHWAVHDALESLLKPSGLGTRPVDCPTDQMVFIWAFLSSTRYRIPSDLLSLISGLKFGFRCTEIHSARVRAEQKSKDSPFYGDLPYGLSGKDYESVKSGGSESDGCGDDSVGELEILQTQGTSMYMAAGSAGSDAAAKSAEPDVAAFLERIDNINPEDTDIMDVPLKEVPDGRTTGPHEQVTDALILGILTEDHRWLSATPKTFQSTPYSHVAFIHSIIWPYSHFDDTMTCFKISRDGQKTSYSMDGTTWGVIDYQKWSPFIMHIISKISDAVAQQMPNDMTICDIAESIKFDDLSKDAPHKQDGNKTKAKIIAETFEKTMMSPAEDKHTLFDKHAALSDKHFRKYLKQDQNIKGLLCTLLAICSAVPMRPWQFASILFDSCHDADRNVWLVNGRFVVGKPKAKQQNLDFVDTAFWFPRGVTSELITYLYFQQPFICSLLDKWKNVDSNSHLLHHLISGYGFHKLRQDHSKVWNVYSVLPLRQHAYRCHICLLIMGDVWLCMHKIERPDQIWQPIVIGSYMFSVDEHDELAYLGAQNQKMVSSISNLTRGVIFLQTFESFEAEKWKTSIWSETTNWWGSFLQSGESGAMILYKDDSGLDVPQFKAVCQEKDFLDISERLRQHWAASDISWIAVAATIFDIRLTVNINAVYDTESLLNGIFEE
ncbi:hypothetical protein BJV77DRAFT_964397 [Russula vinacea]|nr:hypothetical protein BJV77DRAFT_964397 [Russula vinacea]